MPRTRDYVAEYERKKTRQEALQDLEYEKTKRQNELQILAMECGLAYSTVMDLLQNGWSYTETPGRPRSWRKIS